MRYLLPFLLLVAATGAAAGAELEIQRVSLHQFEDGPVIPPGYEYLPGEHAWLICRIYGYEAEPVDLENQLDTTQMHLSWKIEAFDPQGVALQPAQTGEVEEVLAREDVGWIAKVTVQFDVPSFAPEGTYRIPIFIKDELDGEEITSEVTFKVRGEELPKVDTLSLRDFRFLAHQDDRFALSPAVYHPGDTLFAAFEVVGYQMEEGNKFEVEFGLTAYSPEDTVMFSQPVAAVETGDGFYPQRWVPAGFNLNLDPDIIPGSYAIGIVVRDKISGAEQEFKHPFRIQ